MNLPNSFVYNKIERIEGGMRPSIKTLGATSPGISILFIRTMIPKNDASSVRIKKKTMANKNPTIFKVLLDDSLETSATTCRRCHRYNMLVKLIQNLQKRT